ncbi:threonine aspartase 1-like protein [Phycomyces blakesleeanus]|uniref:Threonine aspartase 1-like protein n=1 Tax=Phycomyces blakesleeanus TaxID=4837 RepID=A0ABR3AUP0_PHYBL
MTDQPIFIAVHVGAGHLSRRNEARYRSACGRSCEEAIKVLKKGGSAIDAIAVAISVLEDDPITNAGYGSNLTFDGKVECDASLMSGKGGDFGAVGAVAGLKNPIMVAKQMVTESINGLLPCGRVPPMLLTGQGALDWAKEHGIKAVYESSLLTEESMNTYIRHMNILASEPSSPPDYGHDTVGAVCIDICGNIASGVSSGGISLKSPGRVGEAAIYGSGCWAENPTETKPGIACSTSGTGEQIMRTQFTSKCANRIARQLDMQSAMSDSMKKDFLDSPFLRMYDEKSVGIIALRAEKSTNTRIEFWYAHITESMGIGYMSGTSKKPKTFVSRKTATDTMVSSGLLIT